MPLSAISGADKLDAQRILNSKTYDPQGIPIDEAAISLAEDSGSTLAQGHVAVPKRLQEQ